MFHLIELKWSFLSVKKNHRNGFTEQGLKLTIILN